ncbi:MAG: hypothetical protein IJY78_03945 [Bacteroidaceae bacterium]|nr:hypothetical protein [Bacteroidaceae bacterium]
MPIILVCHFEGGSFLGQRTIAKRYNSIFSFEPTTLRLNSKAKVKNALEIKKEKERKICKNRVG